VDHIYGSDQYVNETKTKLKSWPCPQVIAHEAIIARLNRYRLMSGQIDGINRRQFSGADNISIGFSPNYITPNLLFRDALRLKIGDVQVQIKHARGETDDHCWVYFPDTSVLCTGDFFIWAIPNAGNPQKVQRYALEWARELRAMAALNPKVLLPGHGLVILGEERVMQALDDTATLLESLHGQAVSLINQGLTLEEVVESVQVPNNLKQKPYLRPAYDETEFIVRNIWRLYGGWYDGIPSHLKPATEKAKAEEIVNLANGIGNLLARAEELLEAEEYRLATHFAEWAYWAEPENAEARALVRKVYAERAKIEASVMAKGIFRSAAREIETAEQETGKA
jgi:alkyl sulfatase BDS1-like metallo-beta-lactamase superfamily hydrolase